MVISVFLNLGFVDIPNFENAVLSSSSEERSAGTEFHDPDWFLVSSDVLNQEKLLLGVAVTLVDPSADGLVDAKHLFVLLVFLQERIIVTNLNPLSRYKFGLFLAMGPRL